MSSESNESEVSISSDEDLEQDDNLELEGDIINNYNVICELGRGAFSIVWLVYCIKDNKYYALKVQNPQEYKEGLSEINFVKKLPKNPSVFNNIIEHFTEIRDSNKFLCSVWNLHCSNIDSILRKGKYNDGLPIHIVNRIMKQLIEAVRILHRKCRVFHGDIKSDNILVKGINDKDKFIIDQYNKADFFGKYSQAKKDYWIKKGKSLESIDKMSKDEKKTIRRNVHKLITDTVLKEYESQFNYNNMKHSIDSKYIENIEISLGDFGTHCNEDNYYEQSFGTRYYMAPEIILMGKCSYPVDIWAIGCTYYELLTGRILFDPIKDSKYSRDYYHLCLINETCGNFPFKTITKTKYGNKFFTSHGNIIDYEVGDMNRMDNKLSKFLNVPCDTIKENLKRMLEIDTTRRATIDELSKLFQV
jgi:serine/threonine protein kinase